MLTARKDGMLMSESKALSNQSLSATAGIFNTVEHISILILLKFSWNILIKSISCTKLVQA
jgi:hypothetical protein